MDCHCQHLHDDDDDDDTQMWLQRAAIGDNLNLTTNWFCLPARLFCDALYGPLSKYESD